MTIGATAPARWFETLRRRFGGALPIDRRAFDLASGVRAATACAIPVLIAELSGRHELSWIAIVAFWGCQADPGGAWRTRFMAMSAFTLLATIGCLVSLLSSPIWWLSVPLVLFWSFFASFARLYGAAATTVGVLITVAVIVCLGTPAESLQEALLRTGMTLVGGLWAMLLVLVIWRLYPYGPARRAVGECWHAVAAYARTLGELHIGSADEGRWAVAMRDRRTAVRNAIEQARAALTAERQRRPGESGRGELLLVLLADVDQIFETMIALSELLELTHGTATPRVRRALRAVLLRMARQAAALGQGLTQQSTQRQHRHRRSVTMLQHRLAELHMVEAAWPEAVQLLERATHYLDIAADVATGIRPPRTLTEMMGDGPRGPMVDWTAALATWRGNLSFSSLTFRHALRLAITAAIGEAIIGWFDIERGYWLNITAIVILQPFMATTWRRSIERVVGSVLGGLVAAGIGGLIHNPIAIAVLVFPLSVATIALRSVNYTLFVLCLTPQFVLIAELFQTGQVGDWSLAGLRAIDSVVGGVLGLAAGFLLWPSWEAPHLKQRLVEVIASNRDYLATVVRVCDGIGKAEDVQAARRAAGLASANAEASLQRALSEPRRPSQQMIEGGMTIVACMRRMAGVAATLSMLPESIRPSIRDKWVDQLFEWSLGTLGEIAKALEGGRAPPPLTGEPIQPAADLAERPLMQQELARLLRQTEILHAAVDRLATAPE
ncbi:MAG TPA: FUSC family protein [Aliidongia sp.]|nr:FUSC family protein [Aliidongia sp.]